MTRQASDYRAWIGAVNRRRFLRAGVIGGGAVGALALAGCSSKANNTSSVAKTATSAAAPSGAAQSAATAVRPAGAASPGAGASPAAARAKRGGKLVIQ